jgi:hypothetical protein
MANITQEEIELLNSLSASKSRFGYEYAFTISEVKNFRALLNKYYVRRQAKGGD